MTNKEYIQILHNNVNKQNKQVDKFVESILSVNNEIPYIDSKDFLESKEEKIKEIKFYEEIKNLDKEMLSL